MPDSAPTWFAGGDGDLLLFRVNRRPLGEGTLIPAEMPGDVFEHFTRVLSPGWEVVTGRRNQRTWRIGGVEIEEEARTVTGKLGWVPKGEEVVPEWSPIEKDWTSSITAPHGGRVLPFGFDGDSRLLAVLRDPSSAPTTIGGVFEKVLRENERQMLEPTTDWSVEPVLDVGNFLDWLHTLDIVRSVSFTAKLPNPEPRADFEDLVKRMEQRRATKFSEKMESERDEGLVGVEQDPDFQQAVAMGSQGFATLRGRGEVGGIVTKYSQNEVVAAEHVNDLPDNWNDMRKLITSFLKGRLRRFIDGDEHAS